MIRTLKVETYVDAEGEHRWRLIDPSNNLIIGASTQGYSDERDLRHNLAQNFSDDYGRIVVDDDTADLVVDLSNGMTIPNPFTA